MSKRKKKWHECNVVQAGESDLHLWQFYASDRRFALKSEIAETEGKRLPQKAVHKTWRNLIQPKLNIAWLPENQSFLRTLQMPECEAAELRQMLEFQLEKVSPLPVGQIVWSYETIPSAEEGQLTALVIVAEAAAVETHLEKLESAGYQPDRLEVPWCHELLTLDLSADQLWIRLGKQGESVVALSAWILNQTLRHAAIARLPDTEEGRQSLAKQLERTAWTGEMEGWLSRLPPAKLRLPPECDGRWSDALQLGPANPAQTQVAPPPQELAVLSARRAVRGESQANLLPETRRTRYRQQITDRMWMKGIAAAILLYVFGVIVYLAVLEWTRQESDKLQAQVRTTALAYTNVLKLQAKVEVLQEQMDLKFSALECLRVISERLPAELTLAAFNFTGKSLTIHGTVSATDSDKVAEYHRALVDAQADEVKLFRSVSAPNTRSSPGRNASGNFRWDFECELERTGL